MQTSKVTGEMLKALIQQVLEDTGLVSTMTLPAEPPVEDPNSLPPDEERIDESKTKGSNPVVVAIRLLASMDDEQKEAVFQRFNRQTYDQFLNALSKYERAKKPK